MAFIVDEAVWRAALPVLLGDQVADIKELGQCAVRVRIAVVGV